MSYEELHAWQGGRGAAFWAAVYEREAEQSKSGRVVAPRLSGGHHPRQGRAGGARPRRHRGLCPTPCKQQVNEL